MKHLNAESTRIIRKIHDCMNDPEYAHTLGSYAKIDNGGNGFMPVSVEKLFHIPTFDEHFVISHTYEQNGDLMRDPEMEFVIKDGKYFPITMLILDSSPKRERSYRLGRLEDEEWPWESGLCEKRSFLQPDSKR